MTVVDAEGLSYYSDATLSQRLRMDENILKSAQLVLTRIDLITWKKPIYQVLPLQKAPAQNPQTVRRSNAGEPLSLGQIFKQMAQEAP